MSITGMQIAGAMLTEEERAVWAETRALIEAGDIEGMKAALLRDVEGLAERMVEFDR